MKFIILFLIIINIFIAQGCSKSDDTVLALNENTTLTLDVQYKLTFESTWDSGTNFPTNPHFSGLIGATHLSDTVLWKEGQQASIGIETMAETGSKNDLITEITSLINSNAAQVTISGGGMGTSPGEVSITFSVSEEFPYVSVVSMLAPSPDWFVGVSQLLLYENNDWVDREVILKVYDAGTDSGTQFTSSNANTSPQGIIQLLTSEPNDTSFSQGVLSSDGNSIAKFTFTKVN